jgi:hypothetical protein
MYWLSSLSGPGTGGFVAVQRIHGAKAEAYSSPAKRPSASLSLLPQSAQMPQMAFPLLNLFGYASSI